MKIQSSVLVPLGFGKYVRSDKPNGMATLRVTALVPIEGQLKHYRERQFAFLKVKKGLIRI